MSRLTKNIIGMSRMCHFVKSSKAQLANTRSQEVIVSVNDRWQSYHSRTCLNNIESRQEKRRQQNNKAAEMFCESIHNLSFS